MHLETHLCYSMLTGVAATETNSDVLTCAFPGLSRTAVALLGPATPRLTGQPAAQQQQQGRVQPSRKRQHPCRRVLRGEQKMHWHTQTLAGGLMVAVPSSQYTTSLHCLIVHDAHTPSLQLQLHFKATRTCRGGISPASCCRAPPAVAHPLLMTGSRTAAAAGLLGWQQQPALLLGSAAAASAAATSPL